MWMGQNPQNRNMEAIRDNFLVKSEFTSLNQASDQKLGHRGENILQDVGIALQSPNKSREDLLEEN